MSTTNFWNAIVSAAEAVPQAAGHIRGASGTNHELLVFGVDKNRNRLILVTKEADARSAALVQGDV